MRKLSLIALALMACGSVNAATTVGNTAQVSAPITFGAQNVTDASWTPSPDLASATGVPEGEYLGTLGVTATGSHDGIYVSGQEAKYDNGITIIPFKDVDGNNVLWGKLNDGLINARVTYHPAGEVAGQPNGIAIQSPDSNLDLPVHNTFATPDIKPGTYTATFTAIQYLN